MSKKIITPKEEIENRLRNALNISVDENSNIQRELQQLNDQITQVATALPDAPEFKRLQTELIENKKTALTRQESLQQRLTDHLQRKRIYLRLLNLKAEIAKDFVPFVNKSQDSENLTNPYQYRKSLMREMRNYANFIRHIQEEISACVQLAADIFQENSSAELKIAKVEADAIRNLFLKKIGDGFLPPDGKWDGEDVVKKFLTQDDFQAIENYLSTLKNRENIFEEFIKNIPNDPEIQAISDQIKSFYRRCQDAINLAANAYDKIPQLQRDHLEIQNAQLEQKNKEVRSRAARIIRENPQVSGKIKTLKLSIQKYLNYSKGVLKSSEKEVKDIELKEMNWNDTRVWTTPYNLISQLSRFLQAITHEKVAEIKEGPGSSPPWPLIWKELYAILGRKDQVPDENSEILNEFLEVEQSENASFQELAQQRHKQSIDSREEEEDDDEKSLAAERKQTKMPLRVAPGSECIELVISKMEIFYNYVKEHLIGQNPTHPKELVALYQKIASELKGLIDALENSAARVKKAETQFESLQVIAKQQHDKFFQNENNEQERSLRLQKSGTKLASILSRDPVVSEIRVPKSEEKNSLLPQSEELCKIVLKREIDTEHQMRAAIVQSRSEQSYLRLISRISAINPRDPWQKQMRDFAQAMSEFSKDKTPAALTTPESKFILASRHDLMTQMQESLGDGCTGFLEPYHAEMSTRYSSTSPALYVPESLEADWRSYGKIFNLILEKLQRAWVVYAELEDKRTAEMRITLTSKEIKDSTKISAVLSKLEGDARALIEDISDLDNTGVITVYDRAIEKLSGFQGKLQSVHKEQKYTLKVYQDLWEVTLDGLLKNLQTYKDPVNAKDHDAGEAVRDLNKAEYEIITALITRLSVYSKIFENRHAKFFNSCRPHDEVDEKASPKTCRDIAFDARDILKDKKIDLNSLRKGFCSLNGRVLGLTQDFKSSESYQSLTRQLTALDKWEQAFEEKRQNLLRNTKRT